MQPIIISPPFGTYVRDSRVTPVLGSFTFHKRGGRGLRIAQFALDNLRHPVRNGWRNRIGLRNPGINSLDAVYDNFIYSLVGLEDQDWENLYYILIEKEHHGDITVELNLGCQNVYEYGIRFETLLKFCRSFFVIVKLPSGAKALPIAHMCARAGVHFIHAANTVPDTIGPGSLSGEPAKIVNLRLAEEIATIYPEIPVIGGGGIYDWRDLIDYWNAGATMFSLSTIWFRPWRAKRIITKFHSMADAFGEILTERQTA